MVLNKETLINIKGGASFKKWGLGIILSALGTLFVGILDGYLRPLTCNV